jgi:hypothetical protein
MDSIGMYRTFNKRYSCWQYVAPYRYCFFDSEGNKLGRIIWTNNVQGIYIDKCDTEWGL